MLQLFGQLPVIGCLAQESGILYPSSKLPMLFDAVVNSWRRKYLDPTPASVATIESHLGSRLPNSLISFAKRASHFASWFSSLGDDFQSPDHIIRVNAHYKNRRLRRDRHWVYAKPKNLAIINLGFDQDCDCLNLDTYNPLTGEYEVWYWTPGVAERRLAGDFEEYISQQIEAWAPTNRSKREAFDALAKA